MKVFYTQKSIVMTVEWVWGQTTLVQTSALPFTSLVTSQGCFTAICSSCFVCKMGIVIIIAMLQIFFCASFASVHTQTYSTISIRYSYLL